MRQNSVQRWNGSLKREERFPPIVLEQKIVKDEIELLI